MKRLPGLNGLRAIAASFVLIGHFYQIAGYQLRNEQASAIFQKHGNGDDMVNLFFVISGFIISLLLLNEKGKSGTVSLKLFYFKRILRIWPLYFIILFAVYLLGHFTLVYKDYEPLTFGSLLVITSFILPINDAFLHFPTSVIPHYWSLSVEEQFYLFWPFVIKRFNIFKFSIIIFVFWVVFRNIFAYLSSHHSNQIYGGLNSIFLATKFPSMALGAIGAYAFYYKKRWFSPFVVQPMQCILWIMFLATLVFKFYIPYVNYEIKAVLYLLLILSVATTSKPLISLENNFFDVTGKISYGLYMYHWPLIPIIIKLVVALNLFAVLGHFYFVPLALLCYAITYLISYLSFYWFESYFLDMKPKKTGKLNAHISTYTVKG